MKPCRAQTPRPPEGLEACFYGGRERRGPGGTASSDPGHVLHQARGARFLGNKTGLAELATSSEGADRLQQAFKINAPGN